jgi:hypothetical protein
VSNVGPGPDVPQDDWSGATCQSIGRGSRQRSLPASLAWLLTASAAIAVAAGATGCEDSEQLARLYAPQQGALNAECSDSDGDGYGPACIAGRDCDDDDASLTNECYRCTTPDVDCACDEPGEVVACGKVHARVGDRVSCTVGERTCEQGAWGACRYPGGQTVRSISAPLLRSQSVSTNPSACEGNPCDPFCHEYADKDSSPGTDGGAVAVGDGVSLESGSGDGAGPVEACSGPPAHRPGVTVRFVLQSTASMAPAWAGLESGLADFAQDSPGMVAGLDYFPTQDIDDRCDASEYEDASFSVPLGEFPGLSSAQLAALTTSLGSRVDQHGKGTAMLPALNGALSSAALLNPEDTDIVVLIADGVGRTCAKCGGKTKTVEEKNLCAASKTRDLVAEYYQKGVRTYVVAVDTQRANADLSLLDEVALAGSGGEQAAFQVDGLSGAANSAVESALREIRHSGLSCEWNVQAPNDGIPDPFSFEASLTVGGETTDLRRHSRLSTCDDNEGFTVDTAAQKAVLCPASCEAARSDFGAELDVSYTCRGACSSGSQEASLVPVDMFAMMDRSGSMLANAKGGGKKRWEAVTEALVQYSGSDEAADNGLALSYFPYPTECYECRRGGILSPLEYCLEQGRGEWSTVACDPARSDIIYGNHDPYDCDWGSFYHFAVDYGVPFGILSGSGGAQANAIKDSIRRLDKIEWEYDTDTYSALRTAVQLADDHRKLYPDRKAIALLVTDGEPYTQCERSNDLTLQMTIAEAKAAYARGIETYVIGAGSSLERLNAIALAGSGNRQSAFLVDLDSRQIVKALEAVQQVSMPCWFPIPVPERGDLDYSTPMVVVSKNGKHGTPLSRVVEQSECGDKSAWYYDNNASPSRINLCPEACTTARASSKSRIDIEYRCLAGYADGSVVFEYDSVDTCDRGHRTVWQDWSWSAETPDTSRIRFYAQTGSRDVSGKLSNLSSEFPLEFTAYEKDGDPACGSRLGVCGDTDTQRVGRFAEPVPRPGQVNVEEVLQREHVNGGNYLRVRAELLTSDDASSAPSLNAWHLDVSCEANQ